MGYSRPQIFYAPALASAPASLRVGEIAAMPAAASGRISPASTAPSPSRQGLGLPHSRSAQADGRSRRAD
jgi:hypothetical protein